MTKGKNSEQNTSFSPLLSHGIKQPISNPTSPKSNVVQANDLSGVTRTPQPLKKSTTSPLSSCSNSPSSVRINQNYDPNNLKKQPAPIDETNDLNHGNHGIADGDCELDNSEDADSKPLLNATENTQIVTKRTNGRYEKSDQALDTKAESDTEIDTLITNSHN